MNLIKIIPVVLLGLILSGNIQAAAILDEPYTNSEMTVSMESWMFDTNYLAEVSQSVEAWMLDPDYLKK